MNKFLFASFVLVAVPFVSFAQAPVPTLYGSATVTPTRVVASATVTPTRPGFVPGDFFYFLDRFSESINLTLTINKENKARKHIEIAKERVAEMDQVLKAGEATLADVASAKANFDTQIAEAALIVKAQKDNGADVANLAREFDDELDLSREILQDIYKNHRNKTIQAEAEIRAKLSALLAGDPQIKGLTQALDSVTKEKQTVMSAEGDVDAEIVEEQIIFEDVMGQHMSAGKHMEQAMRLRDKLQAELPAGAATTSQKFINGAEDAIKRGDFKSAKLMFKEAEHMIGEAIDMHDGPRGAQ